MDPSVLAAGAVANELVHRATNKAVNTTQGALADAAGLMQPMQLTDGESRMIELLVEILAGVRAATNLSRPAPKTTSENLRDDKPLIVNRMGRKGLAILSPAQITLHVETSIGIIPMPVAQGVWTTLDLPEEARITLANGGPQLVLLRYTDAGNAEG